MTFHERCAAHSRTRPPSWRRVTVYLSDLALFDEFNAVYVEAFSHRPLPARTTIGAKLVRPELRVELDVIAAVPAGMTGEGE